MSALPPDPSSAGPSPASFHYGPGHLIVHGNGAFLDQFGPVVGQPAREALTALPTEAFELMDRVLDEGRALARWIPDAGWGAAAGRGPEGRIPRRGRRTA